MDNTPEITIDFATGTISVIENGRPVAFTLITKPQHEWVMRVDRVETVGHYVAYNSEGCISASEHDALNEIESIKVLIKPNAEIATPLIRCTKKDTTPLFGVRKLVEGDWFYSETCNQVGAFYNGEYIEGSARYGKEYKECIKRVLAMLKPAQPAITLADLETVKQPPILRSHDPSKSIGHFENGEIIKGDSEHAKKFWADYEEAQEKWKK